MIKHFDKIQLEYSLYPYTSRVYLLERTDNTIHNVALIFSKIPIAEAKDTIWDMCNWACHNGTLNYCETYKEYKDDACRVSENDNVVYIPSDADIGFVSSNICIQDNDDPLNPTFHVSRSFGWGNCDTLSQALEMQPF